MDNRGAGDRGRAEGGGSVLPGATEEKGRCRDQPLGIQNRRKTISWDGNTKREWSGGL